MENKRITGVLVDVIHNTIEEITIIDTLDNLYKILNCDTIDIIKRSINGKLYHVVCDDNALLKNPIPRIGLVNPTGDSKIYGNAFICGDVDCEGDLTSLNEDDIKSILRNATVGTIKYKKDDKDEYINDVAVLVID